MVLLQRITVPVNADSGCITADTKAYEVGGACCSISALSFKKSRCDRDSQTHLQERVHATYTLQFVELNWRRFPRLLFFWLIFLFCFTFAPCGCVSVWMPDFNEKKNSLCDIFRTQGKVMHDPEVTHDSYAVVSKCLHFCPSSLLSDGNKLRWGL